MHGREAEQAAGIEFEDVPNRDMIDLETTEQKRDNFTYIADKFVKIAIRLLGFKWLIVRCWLSGGSGFERFELKYFQRAKIRLSCFENPIHVPIQAKIINSVDEIEQQKRCSGLVGSGCALAAVITLQCQKARWQF